MFSVKCLITAIEVNGKIAELETKDKHIHISNHDNNCNLFIMSIGEHRLSIRPDDMINAVKNAMNDNMEIEQ